MIRCLGNRPALWMKMERFAGVLGRGACMSIISGGALLDMPDECTGGDELDASNSSRGDEESSQLAVLRWPGRVFGNRPGKGTRMTVRPTESLMEMEGHRRKAGSAADGAASRWSARTVRCRRWPGADHCAEADRALFTGPRGAVTVRGGERVGWPHRRDGGRGLGR